METTAERILELYRRGGGYTDTERAEIEAHSVSVLGRGVRKCNCEDRWSDAVIEIYTVLKRNGQITFDMATKTLTAADRKYVLKSGVVLEWKGKYYTRVNITDEVAAAYLEKFPTAVGRFDAVPALPKKEPQKEDPKGN